jgi:quercetin dioxygenase-like cupin family protein
VAEGQVRFFLGDEAYDLDVGDMIAIPPDVPHSIQLLSAHARLVDSFSPVRDDFLGG